MTTDHTDLIDALRRGEFKAHKLTSRQTEKLLGMAADALEALTAARTITINDTAVEMICREACKGWRELDVPLREERRALVKNGLKAAYAAQNPEGDPRG